MNNPGSPAFEIKILDQDWLENEQPQFDLCSHGHISLKIGGRMILDGREAYGLSESALALLRTLKYEHNPSAPVAEKLIFHGCGPDLMLGCPIGVDWNIRHHADTVTISNVRRWDWPDENRPTLFDGLTVEMPLDEYRQAVRAFAWQVKDFFSGQEKVFFDQNDQLAYEKFWAEFDQRLSAHPENSA